MLRYVFILLLTLNFLNSRAQHGFWAGYPQAYSFNSSSCFCATPDSNLLLVKNYYPQGLNACNMMSTDRQGHVRWARRIGTAINSVNISSINTAMHGGFIACGYIDSSAVRKMALFRFSNNGEIRWTRKFTDSNPLLQLSAQTIIEDMDGNFVITAQRSSTPRSLAIIKTDSTGNLLWWKALALDVTKLKGCHLVQLADSSYALCSSALNTQGGFQSQYIVRISKSGNPLWGKKFDFANNIPVKIIDGGANNIITAGYYNPSSNPFSRIYLLGIDTAGNLNWSHEYFLNQNLQLDDILLLPGNRIVVTGHVTGITPQKQILFVTDSSGSIHFAKGYEDLIFPVARYSQLIRDATGDFFLFGDNNSWFNRCFLLMRVDSTGNLPCGNLTEVVNSQPVSPNITSGYQLLTAGHSYESAEKLDSLIPAGMNYLCANSGSFYTDISHICAGSDTVRFTNTGDTLTNNSYWYINGVLTDSTANFSYIFNTPGTYTLTLVLIPAMDSSSVSITVMPSPPVPSLLMPDSLCVNDPYFDLLPLASPAGGIFSGSYLASNATQFHPGHAGVGAHIINYTVTNSYGCTAADSELVYIDACTTIPETATTGADLPHLVYQDEQLELMSNSGTPFFIALIDLTGRFVLPSRKITSENTRIALTDLAPGMYLVRLNTAEHAKTIRIIKQ